MASPYCSSYALRYHLANVQQQTEVAVVKAAEDIFNEDPSTPDHTNRWAWASWANKNSSVAFEPFRWPVSLNPSIQAAVEADPSGQSVADSDVQYVVNSNLNAVIADFTHNPPSGVHLAP
jgi:hypothetical protein